MKTAVVIGAGMAGLASAKMLSDFYDKVTVYNGGPQPQSNHLHVLLKKGQDILFEIFPDIQEKMIEAKCPKIDWAQDTLWENISGSFPRYHSSVQTLSMGRSLIQDLMKQDVLMLSNVTFVDKRFESSNHSSDDLVVIAAGQNYPLGRMLAHEEIKMINLTYRSYVFKQDNLNMDNFKQYYYQVDPPETNLGCVICPIENEKMMVTLIEHEENFSPCKSFEDFMTKGERIPGGRFKRIIANALPLSEMSVFRKTTTHRRKLNLSEIPQNTIILGDAVTSLNPVFGQGMTVSLMQVKLLKQLLKSGLSHADFHRKSYRLSFMPYTLSNLNKLVLRKYLQICQRFRPLHHDFLKRLHSP